MEDQNVEDKAKVYTPNLPALICRLTQKMSSATALAIRNLNLFYRRVRSNQRLSTLFVESPFFFLACGDNNPQRCRAYGK